MPTAKRAVSRPVLAASAALLVFLSIQRLGNAQDGSQPPVPPSGQMTMAPGEEMTMPPAAGNKPTESAMPMEMDEIAHPFLAHMGVPEAVGTYDLRLMGMAVDGEGDRDADAGFHLETGLTDNIGLHLRNNAFFRQRRTELMLQFAGLRSADRMSGVSPLIEFEVPTQSVHGTAINTFVGFTTSLENGNMGFSQNLEYSPNEESLEGELAFVFRVRERFFPVIEVNGEAAKGESPIINQLVGLKVRMNSNLFLGLAGEVPLTTNKDFSSQVILQAELRW